jgi:hypothetical protein
MKLPNTLKVIKEERIGSTIVSHIVPKFGNGEWVVQEGNYFLLRDGWNCHCAISKNGDIYMIAILCDEIDFRKATLNETKECFDILKKFDYTWNGKRLVKRERVAYGYLYYFMNDRFNIEVSVDAYGGIENARFKAGNYFTTPKKAEMFITKQNINL